MSNIAPNNRRRKEKWQMIWNQGFMGYAVFRVELTSGKQKKVNPTLLLKIIWDFLNVHEGLKVFHGGFRVSSLGIRGRV